MRCEDVLSRCLEHLSKGFSIEPIGEGCILHTPYLDPENDPISIFVKEKNNIIRVTDQTEVMGFLFLHGIDLKPKSKQRWYLETTANRLDVQIEGSELFIQTSADELPDAIYRLLEAIHSAMHLMYTAKTRSHLIFYDEVSSWLRELNIPAEEKLQVIGAAGKPIDIDFSITRQNKHPAYMYALHSETPGYARTLVNKTIVNFIELKDTPIKFTSVCLLDDTVEEDVWSGPFPILKRHTDAIGFWDSKEELLEVII